MLLFVVVEPLERVRALSLRGPSPEMQGKLLQIRLYITGVGAKRYRCSLQRPRLPNYNARAASDAQTNTCETT